MRWSRIALHTAWAAAVCGAGQAAWGGGYQLDLQSVRAQGSSNAGSAEAADPSTIFYNPAGLTLLDGTQLVIGATAVEPHSTFSYSDATNGSGATVSPADSGGNYAKSAAIPHGYLSHRVNDRVTVGVGVFAPFGAKLSYDDDFAGRYYGRAIDFQSIAINPSLGLKLNEHHRIGFGLTAQYITATLDKNLDTTPVASAVCMAGGGDQTTCSAVAAVYTGQPDAKAHITGHDWGYGFNLGYMFTPNDATRIGLAYRSYIRHKLRGTADFTVPDSLPGGSASPINAGIQTALASSGATIGLTTPETVSLNVYHQLNSRWAVMGDVTWSRQDRLQSIVIEMPTSQVPDRKITYKTDWQNSWRASVGTSYQLNEHWTLRGGYMYDQTPVSDARYAVTILPDSSRQMFSFGASYRIDARNTIDLAYSYLKLKGSTIKRTDDDYDSSNGSPSTLTGSYRSHANLLGIGYTHKF